MTFLALNAAIMKKRILGLSCTATMQLAVGVTKSAFAQLILVVDTVMGKTVIPR